jgi:hypothetical protein
VHTLERRRVVLRASVTWRDIIEVRARNIKHNARATVFGRADNTTVL